MICSIHVPAVGQNITSRSDVASDKVQPASEPQIGPHTLVKDNEKHQMDDQMAGGCEHPGAKRTDISTLEEKTSTSNKRQKSSAEKHASTKSPSDETESDDVEIEERKPQEALSRRNNFGENQIHASQKSVRMRVRKKSKQFDCKMHAGAAKNSAINTSEKINEERSMYVTFLTSIPTEVRCKNFPRCYKMKGHLGRCPFKPPKEYSILRKYTGQANISISELIDQIDENGAFMGTENNVDQAASMQPNKKMHQVLKPSDEAQTIDVESDPKLSDCQDQVPIVTVTPDAGKRIFSSPQSDHCEVENLQGPLASASKLVQTEFRQLSGDHINIFYVSSRAFPVTKWKQQKQVLSKVCKLLEDSPPVCFLAPNKKDKSLAALKSFPDSPKFLDTTNANLAYSECRSEIHGTGISATIDLNHRAFVTELCGEVVTAQQALARKEIYKKKISAKDIAVQNCIGISKGVLSHENCYLFNLGTKWCLDATVAGSMAKFVNHSCEPNCEFIILTDDDKKDRICMYTVRKVKKGEELTCDYGSFHKGFECNCCSSSCRKKI